MRILNIFILILSCTICAAQDSWYRDIKYEQDVPVTAFHMLTTGTEVYISGKANCTDSLGQLYSCMSLAKHDYNGDVIWWTYLPWTNSANEGAISLLNDTLIITGHYFNTEKRRIFIDMFSIDGIHLKSDQIIYDSTFHSEHGFWNNGQILLGRNLYIQCETRNLDKVNTTITTEYNLDTGESSFWDIHVDPIGTPSFSGYDFCLDIDSNFVVSSKINAIGGDFNRDIKQITKFDREGNILDKFFGPDHDMSSSVIPEMTVMKDGRYVILHNINEFIQVDVPQIACIDPSTKDICWTYDYTSKLDTNRLVTIGQLAITENGDLIGSGGDLISELHGGNNYYVFRMSPKGEMLWQRTFVRQDNNDVYIRGAFRDIQELSDGSILAIGSNGDGHIGMMRLSADGCLMGEYCESLNFIGRSTSINEIAKKQLKVYPSLATEKITIDLGSAQEGKITVVSSEGFIVFEKYFTTTNLMQLDIDVSSFASGLYYISLNDISSNGFKTRTSKFIKY